MLACAARATSCWRAASSVVADLVNRLPKTVSTVWWRTTSIKCSPATRLVPTSSRHHQFSKLAPHRSGTSRLDLGSSVLLHPPPWRRSPSTPPAPFSCRVLRFFPSHASHTQTLYLHLPHLQRVRPSVNLFRSLPPHRSQRTAPRIHQTVSRQKARVYQQQKHERRAACRGRGAAEHVY